MKKTLFNQITIVGVGLLGGSLAKVIRQRKIAKKVYGICRSQKSVNRLKKIRLGCKPVLGLDEKILSSSDLVILATSVKTIIRVMPAVSRLIGSETIVTDIGSTKQEIQQAANKYFKEGQFVGCHPMAGKEKSGPEFADSMLFSNALCFVMRSAKPKNRAKVSQFWKAIGSRVVLAEPKEHDRIVAKVSHLPHLVSTALLSSMLKNDPHQDIRYGGTGLAGMIRIAGANPPMWFEIFESNRHFVKKEVELYIRELQKFKKALSPKNRRQLLKMLLVNHRLKQFHK